MTALPAVKQELKDLKSIGAAPDIEIGTDIGYWSAQTFIQLLEATKARGAAITPADLAATVSKGITLKPALAGGDGPLTLAHPVRPARAVHLHGGR